MKHLAFIYIILCLFVPARLPAQSEVSTRDKVEISYRAEQMISELNDLYNILTFADVFESEVQTLIENSYSGSQNQLFYNDRVVIEDDIDPTHFNRSNVRDLEISQYLSELNLSYQKSDDYTVKFSGIKASKVYEKSYPYVLVYFESTFTSKHKTISQAYRSTQRIAEIRAEKIDKEWKTYISSITFADPSVAFEEANYETEGMPGPLNSTAIDTAGMDEGQKRIVIAQEQQRREQQKVILEVQAQLRRLAEKEQKEEKQKIEVGKRLIQEGDEAFAVGEFETALQAYNESKQINPYQTDAFRKINEVNKVLADREAQLQQEVLRYQDLTRKGAYSYRIRDFDAAVAFYRQAQEIRPRADSVAERIREIEKVELDNRRYGEKERTGDFLGAIKDYSRALKEQPNNADLFVSRAACYEKTDKPKKAIEDYTEALAIYDEYHIAHLRRGDLQANAGEYALSEVDYSRALSLKREDPDTYVKRSQVRQMLGDMPNAIADYSTAIRQQPTNGKLYLERGHLYLRTNEKEKAFDDFTSSLTLGPQLFDAWYQRGWLSIERDEIIDASEDFARARKEGLMDSEWNRVVAQGQMYYQTGQNGLQGKQYPAAEIALTNAVTIDPDFAPAWYARAQAREAQRDFSSAVEDYTEAIRLNPAYADAYYRRGGVKAGRGEFKAAAQDFSEASRIQPNMISAHIARAEALKEAGNKDEAIFSYQKAQQIESKRADLYYQAGLLFLELEQYPNAVTEFDQAIRNDKQMATAYYHRGLAKHQQKLYPLAAKDHKKAIQFQPIYPEAYRARALAYQEAGKAKKALPDYQVAVQQGVEPLWEAYEALGDTQFELANYAGAGNSWEKARELNPQLVSRDLFLNMGTAYLHTQKWEEAQSYFENILELDERSHKAKYGLADLYAGQGLNEQAIKFLGEALASGNYSLDHLKKDPFLKNLKKDPSYKALIDQHF